MGALLKTSRQRGGERHLADQSCRIIHLRLNGLGSFSVGWQPVTIYDASVKIMVSIILGACFCCLHAGQTSTAWIPHPIGEQVATTIMFGDAYTMPIEVYDAKICVVEVVRGDPAWNLLKNEDPSIYQPEPESEYIVARIRFEFAARGKPGDQSYTLKEDQFVALSADGLTQYRSAKVVPPRPRLDRTLRSGESADGWVPFVVSRSELKPMMLFRSDVRDLSHNGAGPAFRLY